MKKIDRKEITQPEVYVEQPIERRKGRRYRVAIRIPCAVHEIPTGTLVEVVGWHPERGVKLRALPCLGCGEQHEVYLHDGGYLEKTA